MVILYVDDILILSREGRDRYCVKDILEKQYEKVTVSEGERLPYLGMTIIKTSDGFEVCMKAYIEDIIKFSNKNVQEYVTPAKPNLFKIDNEAQPLVQKTTLLLPVTWANEDVLTYYSQCNFCAPE